MPSELVGYEGTPIEKLLFNIEVLSQSPQLKAVSGKSGGASTAAKIRQRRKELGIV